MPGLANNENAEIDEHRFFFVHRMKTGGTSFAFHLHKHFQPHEIYASKGLDRRDEADIAGYVSISRLLRTSPERRAEVWVVTDIPARTTVVDAPARPVRDVATP